MFVEILERRSAATGIALSAETCEKLAIYHEMLTEANKVMNLTRVPDDPEEAIDRNYLDSLAPLAVPGLLAGARTLCDVGSGAGFPGLPLAIALPNLRVTMIDALQKRVRFLNDVIARLGLNAVALHARSEDAARDTSLRGHFDAATARAVAALPSLLELTLPFVKRGGVMIAYKGPAIREELPAASAALRVLGGRVRDIYQVTPEGRDWAHCLLAVDKVSATPPLYPRKAGEPTRNPITA